MSGTPAHAIDAPQDRSERLQRWAAALVTVLLHLLLVLLVLQDSPITLTTPKGGSGGSRMDVTLIDQTLPPSSSPSPPEPVPPKKPKAPRAIKRPPPIPVQQGTVPMPPEAADTAKTSTAAAEPDARRDRVEVGFPMHRPPDDAAQANAELAAKLGVNRGQSDTPAPAGPNMGVDGFHVYYELVNETRLRAWRKQGMTELFLPMPGTRRLMVCPLEVALRRGYGECRMVEQDSPQLKVIGDAREVINIQRVYQLGNMVWSGPGPYR